MALTKLNNNGIAGVTALPSSIALGDMVLVSSATASSSATIDFTLGDYKEYQFYFVNMHPATDSVEFQFNLSTDSGSNYNVTKTSTYFTAYHDEADTNSGLSYETGLDLAQGTGFQPIFRAIGNGADESGSCLLTLFNPSSEIFVKHFINTANGYHALNYSINDYVAGYANTTSALTNIRFQMSSGNIDSGTILMYGIN